MVCGRERISNKSMGWVGYEIIMISKATKQDGELSIYVDRMVMMMQLLRIYSIVLKIPENDKGFPHTTMRGTMAAVVYSFFYSLIEDDNKGVNFFRIWRERAPEFKEKLDKLEAKVSPFKDKLRLFRNRFGFHGSTNRKYEARAWELLADHSGSEIMDVIIETRNLSSELIQKKLHKDSNIV